MRIVAIPPPPKKNQYTKIYLLDAQVSQEEIAFCDGLTDVLKPNISDIKDTEKIRKLQTIRKVNKVNKVNQVIKVHKVHKVNEVSKVNKATKSRKSKKFKKKNQSTKCCYGQNAKKLKQSKGKIFKTVKKQIILNSQTFGKH